MSRLLASIVVCFGSALQMVQAQYSTAGPLKALGGPKAPSLTLPGATGSFAMGVDNCAAAHTNAGVGDVVGVPYTTGTTGVTGQNEANCLAFGLTGIDDDVWFDWTATATGTATLTTCGNATDTKVAIYPLSICPVDGTSLTCNDDQCSVQSAVVWFTSVGTTYTIQLGTFPGAAGGSGTFQVLQTTCGKVGQYDDGQTENAVGLMNGGEIGWLNGFACVARYDAVVTAYGTAAFPSTLPAGATSKIVAYEQYGGGGVLKPGACLTGGNCSTPGLCKVAEVNTVVTAPGTDLLVQIPLGTRIHRAGGEAWTWVMATADHAPGEAPAPLDQNATMANSWVVGSTLGPGTLNTCNLFANDVPPVRIQSAGFSGAWVLRVTCTSVTCDPLHTRTCFGDGSLGICPCGNYGRLHEGCANGTGFGATLYASGNASVSSDTLSLTADGVINNNGLFFQGNNTIAGGAGVSFGDGLRCCGGSVVRIQVVNPPGTMSPATAQMTETATTNGPSGTITPGTKKCYQYWYRDPATSPCGAQFNLTNAVSVTWAP